MQTLFESWGTMAHQISGVFTSTMSTAVSSVSDAFTGLILNTKSWGQALAQIGNTILTTIVQSIVEMGVKWVLTHVIMGSALSAFHALAAALGWTSASHVIAQESAKAPVLAVNASTAGQPDTNRRN